MKEKNMEVSSAANQNKSEQVEWLNGVVNILDLLARLYFKPLSQEEINALIESGFGEIDDTVEPDKAEEVAYEMRRYLVTSNEDVRKQLNIDFTASFYGVASFKGQVASPYESVFTSEDQLLAQGASIAAYREYMQERLKVQEDLDYPSDHLSFELEYLAVLSQRAVDALTADERAEAQRLLEKAKEFLEKHVRNWFFSFSEVANTLLKTDFYKNLVVLSELYFAEIDEGFAEILSQFS